MPIVCWPFAPGHLPFMAGARLQDTVAPMVFGIRAFTNSRILAIQICFRLILLFIFNSLHQIYIGMEIATKVSNQENRAQFQGVEPNSDRLVDLAFKGMRPHEWFLSRKPWKIEGVWISELLSDWPSKVVTVVREQNGQPRVERGQEN